MTRIGRQRVAFPARGFSLAEAVIAVLILSTLSVVLVGVVPATMYAMKTAENRAKAACIGREIIEGVRCGGFDHAVNREDTRRSNGTEFTIKVTVSPVRDESGLTLSASRVKNVEVLLSWNERNTTLTHFSSIVLYRQ